jgi:hypothetical protein
VTKEAVEQIIQTLEIILNLRDFGSQDANKFFDKNRQMRDRIISAIEAKTFENAVRIMLICSSLPQNSSHSFQNYRKRNSKFHKTSVN